MQSALRTDGVRVRVRGRCMAPGIPDGALVELRARRVRWPGDVVALQIPGGGARVHRVLGYVPTRRGLALLTQADAEPAADPPAPLRDVIGTVVGVAEPVTPVRVSWRHRARAAARYLRWWGGRLRGGRR